MSQPDRTPCPPSVARRLLPLVDAFSDVARDLHTLHDMQGDALHGDACEQNASRYLPRLYLLHEMASERVTRLVTAAREMEDLHKALRASEPEEGGAA